MKKVIIWFIMMAVHFSYTAKSQTVAIQYDPSSAQAGYAVKILEKALEKQGCHLTDGPADYSIALLTDAGTLPGEAYTILPEGKKITIKGGDGRGIIYGSL